MQPMTTNVLSTTPADETQLLQDKAQPLGTSAPDMVYKPQTETWDAAKAGWQRYTFVNQAAMAVAAVNGIDATDDHDPTYNQYAYAQANRAEYADIWDNILAGHFDEVRSETGFKRRAFMIRENKALDEEVGNAGLSGQLAGMGLSLFDVTSLIGGGAFVSAGKGAGVLNSVARAAKIGMVEGAATEVLMQGLDPTQTWKDAVVNIGFSGLAGGALGGLAHFVMPHTKLGLSSESMPRSMLVILRGLPSAYSVTSFPAFRALSASPVRNSENAFRSCLPAAVLWVKSFEPITRGPVSGFSLRRKSVRY